MRSLAPYALGLLVAAGCARAPRPTYSATFTDRSIRIASYVRTFRAAEPALLMRLSDETRLFARIHPKPTPDQLASPDALPFGAGNWLSRGWVDPFLFTDRAAGLGRARAILDALALPPARRAELLDPSSPVHEPPELRAVRLEQESFRRLLDAEDARVERERTLPKGAADLFRTVLLGWPISARTGAMHDVDSMLAWRLLNVEQSLAPSTMSEAERDDLRAVLAELAPRVAPLPHAASAMAKLRDALDGTWVTPYATEDEATMDRELELYVGSPLAFDALDSAFARAERAFDVQVDAGFSVLDEAAAARVTARATAILEAAPACAPRVPVRTPFDLGPPDERAWACSLVHALDDARTDENEIAADLAWRDAIVVARWAVSTHGPVRTHEAALRRGRLREPLPRATQDRLFVLAGARPLRAIAAGVAAVLLTREGGARIRARAARWRAIGEGPMDLIDTLVGPEKNFTER
jgi:hypothetical protein